MPNKYTKAVLDAYEKKKQSGTLSPNLLNPTPGSFREECVVVYHERYSDKDNAILSMFFSDVDIQRDYLKAIKNSRAVKFKQMPKILGKDLKTPGIKYIELLAWLIDFSPRPSTLFDLALKDTNVPIENTKETIKTDREIVNFKNPESAPKIWQPKVPVKQYLILGLGITFIGTLIFLFWMVKIGQRTINADEKCMFWTGNHYEASACNVQTEAIQIPLDIRKINKFKKITTIDKLTKNDLGKIWYIKIDNQPEFFTDSGFYPLDTTKKLKPITPYILSKYVSYPKYVLNKLIWSISLAITLITITFIVIRFRNRKGK